MARRAKIGKVSLQPKIAVEEPPGLPVFYVNYMEAASGPNDIAITAVKIGPRFSPSRLAEIKESASLTVEADVQIIFPATILPGLIRALNTVRTAYEKNTGYVLKDQGASDE